MYGSRPRNWYEMSYDEQREWKRQQQAIEDAEYDARRAKEEAEEEASSMRRRFNQERESLEAGYSELQAEVEYLRDLNAELLQALIHLSNEAMGSAELARECIGNTNTECLLQRAQEARVVIAKAEGK